MAVPLFQPFRALGYITDDIPFAVQRLGREAFVTVSAGKAWQVRASNGPIAMCWCRHDLSLLSCSLSAD